MNDELLNYYQQELNILQQSGAEFAKHYPKLASHLQVQNLENTDPHVARLIEAVAFMNAQVKHKLDDEFSLFSEGLFDIVQPAYRQPLPAMVIAQFNPQPDLTQPITIARHTALETLDTTPEPLRFQTCYETSLLPLTVKQAELLTHCETAPALSNKQACGCLHLVLQCLDPAQSFAQLAPKTVRFFLKGNQATAFSVYDMLFRYTTAIGISQNQNDQAATFLDPKQLQPVGFANEETILPYNARQPLAYQLLTEYFAYPEKFLFIELQTEQVPWQFIGNELHLYFYLQQVPHALPHSVTADLFALNCTPIVNLYSKQAEPLTVTGQCSDYLVIPDIRQPHYHEIYTIDQVAATAEDGQLATFSPLFSLGQHGVKSASGYWQTRRQATPAFSELSIRLTNLKGQPLLTAPQVLQITTTCFNPAIQALWQKNNEQTQLQLTLDSAPVTTIHALTNPSRVIRPQLAQGNHWRLVSSMALSHIPLAGDQGAALREVLQLYDLSQQDQHQALIHSIKDLQTRHLTLRLATPGQFNFCQGLAITLTLNEQPFAGSSAWLFAHLLAQFLALHASINSFVQLQVVGENSQHLLYQGKPLVGQQALL